MLDTPFGTYRPAKEDDFSADPQQDAEPSRLDRAIHRGKEKLLTLQHREGYWRFDLETDCGITSDYILMMHYMGEVDDELQKKISAYLHNRQGSDGGWPLYYGGPSDLSCSVKTYFALKLAGDLPELPHMEKAREAILNKGGAACAKVFTRITLALFQQIPWRGVPFLPVEIMLLPRWFPFHILKISYWSRTVMVPLSILCSLKPCAKNPDNIDIQELFIFPPNEVKSFFPNRSFLNTIFLILDHIGRNLEPFIPNWIRQRALKKAENWILDRLNGTGGLGAIIPAMINAYQVMDCLEYPPENLHRMTAKMALKKLLVVGEQTAWAQPCVSPVWDTGLSCLTLQEVENGKTTDKVTQGLNWLKQKQLLHEPGDWKESRPSLEGGGWAFEFQNSHYPDLDDTALVAYSMYQSKNASFDESIRRAAEWIVGMQSKEGGFASYEVDNTHYYLNEIPFADHGALLDPPSSDVSARCLMLLSVLDPQGTKYHSVRKTCLAYILREQTESGSWYGRWGTNYIYGTWSVLIALEVAGIPSNSSTIQRAAEWLKRMQRSDGGWGEDNNTYWDESKQGQGSASTLYQTAWALLGLMAAGEKDSPEVGHGIDYLIGTQRKDGLWEDPSFCAPGFPRILYLKYHGYDTYFPLLALARYRNLSNSASI